MPTNVIMPQMGESIAEGTLTKWLKKPGDAVKRDEPLFEISTDKVDAEIPSPGAGTLLEILVPEGQTVAINTVVARLGEAGRETALPQPAAAGGDGEILRRRGGTSAELERRLLRGTGPATRGARSRAFQAIFNSLSPSSSSPAARASRRKSCFGAARRPSSARSRRRRASTSRRSRARASRAA